MTDTPHLALTYIDPAQSQKHVTHNEALRALDALVHLSVADRNRLTPPASPLDGARTLLGTGATGVFAGQDGKLATYQDGAWRFLAPRAGWRLFVEAESLFIVFDGSLWHDIGAHIKALDNLDHLGIGTTADASNPLSAKLNATLFTARTVAETGTGDLRFKLNKEAAAKTVSQLYQTGFSGRAETGLMGDDRFRLKVSADGTTWKTALDVDPLTGTINFPSGATGAAIVWRGTWAGATAYAVNDTVAYGGSTYIALLAGTGQTPSTSTTFWGLVAQQGAAGGQGIPGAMGATLASGLGFLSIGLPTTDVLDMTDTAGNRIFGVDALGTFQTNSLNVAGNLTVGGSFVPSLGALPRAVPLLALASGAVLASVTVDRNGNVITAQDYAGNIYDANGLVKPGIGIAPACYYDAVSGTTVLNDPGTILMFVVWGQSWAQGANAGSDATFDTVALDPGQSLMFNSGVRPNGGACTAFVDLLEGTNQSNSKNSICARMAHALQVEFAARFGAGRQILFGIAASGGQPYTTLKKGTPTYAEALRMVAAAVGIARGLGKKIVVAAMPILHGEQDFADKTPRAEYRRDLLTLRQDFDADFRAITGQTLPVRFIVEQACRGSPVVGDPRVATAVLDAAELDVNFVCIGSPIFVAGDNSGAAAHPTCAGFAQMGEWFGNATLKTLFGNGYEPVRIASASWIDATHIRAEYSRAVIIDASSAIVDDTAISAGHGLDFKDGSGAGPTIASVVPVASVVTMTVAGATVTLGGAGAGTGVSFNTSGLVDQDVLTLTNNGVTYGLKIKPYDTYGGAATALAALVPGATASGLVITVGAPVGLAATGCSNKLTITLSGTPASKARPQLFCAVKTTGTNATGAATCARTTIRFPLAFTTSATPGNPKLYEWACAQAIDLPVI